MPSKLVIAAAAWTCLAASEAVRCAEPTPLVQPPGLLPADMYVAQRLPEPIAPPPAEAPPGLTIDAVEAIALACNPSIAEAAARVRAARGQAYQVGLPPNPSIGYLASEIGNDGHDGQQGLVISQEFVRGNKLELNRAIESREVQRLRDQLAAQQRRVLTDVRIAFFATYLAQQRVVVSRNLQAVGSQSATTAQRLLEAQEGRRMDLLQAEIESQRADVDLIQAESMVRGAWRRLAALAGRPDLAEQPLAAAVETLSWPLSWDETRARLLRESPEIAAALAEVEKARFALRRACVEPTPNVTAEASVQYDDSTSTTIAGAQVSLPIPIWNRNQGGIAKANGNLMAAERRLRTIELGLEQRLAAEFQDYESSIARATTLRTQILDRARQTLDVATQGYRGQELSFIEFLTVQRTYFQANLEYLTALGQVNESVQKLEGLLLDSSYQQTTPIEIP